MLELRFKIIAKQMYTCEDLALDLGVYKASSTVLLYLKVYCWLTSRVSKTCNFVCFILVCSVGKL